MNTNKNEENFKTFLIVSNPIYWGYFIIEFFNRNVVKKLKLPNWWELEKPNRNKTT